MKFYFSIILNAHDHEPEAEYGFWFDKESMIMKCTRKIDENKQMFRYRIGKRWLKHIPKAKEFRNLRDCYQNGRLYFDNFNLEKEVTPILHMIFMIMIGQTGILETRGYSWMME